MIKILYFAFLREQLNCSEETLDNLESIKTINDLKQFLSTRNDTWKNIFTSDDFLVSVNQQIVNNNEAINNGDEVAFFPHVTGG